MRQQLRRATLALILGLCPGATIAAAPAAAQTPAGEDARIMAVERSLVPGVIVEGQDAGPFELADRMRHYGVPGVSIAVVDGGQVAWAKGYGVEEAGTDRPVTAETLFQAASISKPVAALAALRLVERGELALDEDVNGWLRRWRVPRSDAARGRPVTVRGLLTHSAGLTVHGFRGYRSDEPVPGTLEVLTGDGPANSAPVVIDLEPGTEYRYSGGGYTVLQLLLEEVTGASFPDLMRDLVLEPVGMRQSTYEQPLPLGMRAHAATGHRADGRPLHGRYHTYPEMAAAGLWTTPADLARYILAVQRARASEEGAIIGPEITGAMLTPGVGGWGLGPSLEEGGSGRRFSHGGANAGFRATFTGWVEGGSGVVVMTNSDAGSLLAQEIVLAVADVYGWPDLEPEVVTPLALTAEALAEYAGVYESRDQPGLVLRMTLREGDLFAEMPGQPAAEMVPLAPDEFLLLPTRQRVIFARADDGTLLGIRSPVRLERVRGGGV